MKLGLLLSRFPQSSSVTIRGCKFSIVSLELYETGVVINWTLEPSPDVSDITIDEETVLSRFATYKEKLSPERQEEALESLRWSERLRGFLGAPTVTDDFGTAYNVSHWGPRTQPHGLGGQIRVVPKPPVGTLHLHYAGADLEITRPE